MLSEADLERRIGGRIIPVADPDGRLIDDVSTDDLAPSPACRRSAAEPDPVAFMGSFLLQHRLTDESVRADLSGAILEGGDNFACGSSRVHAAYAVIGAGITAVIAPSFGDIFTRNATNLGLLLISDADLRQRLKAGGTVSVREVLATYPPLRQEIYLQGGLYPWLAAGMPGVDGSGSPARPMTMTEKLLARAAGVDAVAPNDVVLVDVDVGLLTDIVTSSIALEFAKIRPGNRVKDEHRERFILTIDHLSVDARDADEHKRQGAQANISDALAFARANGIRTFDLVDGESQGISHALLPQEGLVGVGQFIAGGDSHTCTYGAFGSFATGAGSPDMAMALECGKLWFQVPETIRITIDGELAPGVSAKDAMLRIIGDLGYSSVSRALEFHGTLFDTLPVDEQRIFANMAVEAWAVCGVIVPNQNTMTFLTERGVDTSAADTIKADEGATYAKELRYQGSDFGIMVAKPYSPGNGVAIASVAGTKVDYVFIGSCTNGQFNDFVITAALLDGKQVSSDVRMVMVPATKAIYAKAMAAGHIATIEAAGATVRSDASCNACIAFGGPDNVRPGEVAAFATNRNYKGRTGDKTGEVYLVSTATAAKAALAGELVA